MVAYASGALRANVPGGNGPVPVTDVPVPGAAVPIDSRE
jgi:hypothetical protein